MKFKKIIWIALFILVISVFIVVITVSTHWENNNVTTDFLDEKKTGFINSENPEPYKITQLDDGVLYSKERETRKCRYNTQR